MIFISAILFAASLLILIKSAEFSTCYAAKIAKRAHISEFIVSFLIVAGIAVSPESTISIISAIKGVPRLGLGALLGSNVADLTLVFGIVALVSYSGIRIKSRTPKRGILYLLLLLLPLILGLDGGFSRFDGALLVIGGVTFLYKAYLDSKNKKSKITTNHKCSPKELFVLIFSLILLVISASYTVKFGVNLAKDLSIPPVIIGLTVIAIGTCLPELFFSIKAARTKHNGMALGDVLGNVMIDATIMLGITILILPFQIKTLTLLITGSAMFLAGALSIWFINSGRILTKKEGILLLLIYAAYLIISAKFIN